MILRYALTALSALLLSSAASGQTGTVMPAAHQVFFTAAGAPCSGCLLYTYVAGTSTELATYTTSALSELAKHPNPIVLNSAGRASSGPIFALPRSYKYVLKTAAGTEIWSADNVAATPPFFVDQDVLGTAGEAIAAGEAVYLSNGSGGATAGRWYRTDADNLYSSLSAGIVGIAPAGIASGETGSIRIQGRMTGLSGLTVGSQYYASTTAGALTSTAPTNARPLGVADSTTALIVASQANANFLEGIWTPTDASGAGLTFASATGYYAKIGRLVVAVYDITYPATADGTNAAFTLPVTARSGNPATFGGYQNGEAGNVHQLRITQNTAIGAVFNSGAVTNATLSGASLSGTAIYIAAE